MKITSRLTPLTDANMDDEQRRVLSDILSGPRGNLDGPFLAWVHSPQLADSAQKLGAFCRYGTRLELRLSELAILLTAAWWQSQAEWQIHEPIARQAGLAEGVIAAVRELGVPAPIVIRMEGTNVDEGKRLLRESGMNFTTADSMGEAAEKAVALTS